MANIEEDIIYPADDLTSPGINFESPVSNYGFAPELPRNYQLGNVSQNENTSPPNSLQEPLFKPVPNTGKGPVGNYYAKINWTQGFEDWSLVRFSTPMDGSCLFHAISNSFFAPYHNEMLNGKPISRQKIIETLRKELSTKLASNISDDPGSLSHYDTLNGGNTSAFSESVPEFALTYMQSQLNSRNPIGYGYMEFIGNALNKDIYILEAVRHDIYVTDELSLTIKGGRNSIVLYYMNGHYELVGICKKDGSFDTHFFPDHSFIQFLYNKVRSITGR